MPYKTKKYKRLCNRKTLKKHKKPEKFNQSEEALNRVVPFEHKVAERFKRKGIDFTSVTYSLEQQLLKDFKKAVSPSDINPNNDYYSYINDRWLLDFEVNKNQEYIVQVDNFRLTQDKVFNELLDIVKEHIEKNATPNWSKNHAGRMRDLFTSLKTPITNSDSTAYARQIINKIDTLISTPESSAWELIGDINKNEIISWGSPFVVNIAPDNKCPTISQCYVSSPKFTLIDLNMYFNDGTNVAYKSKYRKRYFDYLKDLFENAFGKNHPFNIHDVFEVEVQIIYAIGCEVKEAKKRSSEDDHNIVTKEDAEKIYGFNWTKLATSLGFDTPPDMFITSNLHYLSCGSKLLEKNWRTQEWRTYWVYLFIRQEQRFNKRGRDNHFEFHGKYVHGRQEQMNNELGSVFGLGYAFNEFLSKKYIKKHLDMPSVNYTNAMAEDLRTVFTRIISRNKWFDPSTKKSALKKLNKLKMQIGYPPNLIPDSSMTFSPTDVWENLSAVSLWRHNLAINSVGSSPIDLPEIDWSLSPFKFVGSQSYVVNASYIASENKIYMPSAYLQKPFIDLNDRGVEYNLAHMGFTIAHELSHSLDDWGSTYDENGVLSNWWTDKDRKVYKRIQSDIKKQYETFAKYDGLKFDATLSMGENLADISGLTICREYLRDFQFKNDDILPIQRLSFDVFFVYFAFQQRQHINEDALTAQLKTNPHPLDKYRTNVPLSRLPIFRAMYNIKKGDKMWWPNNSRVWE